MTQNAAVSNTEQSSGLLAASPGVTLIDYFESQREKPSSRIYGNLASDPLMSALFRRKTPTYRELVLVASTVVGALDARIEELERSVRPWERLSNAINAPLLTIKPEEKESSQKESGEEGESPDRNEAKWILKYLTLRNLAGVLLTVLTLSTSFFAFINRHHQTVMDEQEKKMERQEGDIKRLTTALEVKRLEMEGLRKQNKDKDSKYSSLEGRFSATEQRARKLQQTIDGLEAKKSAGAVEQARMEKDLESSSATIVQLKADLKAFEDREKAMADLYKTRDENSGARTVKWLQTSLASTELQRNRAVSAWNDLLYLLASRRSGSTIELKTSELSKHLAAREGSTSKVENMMFRLP